MQLLKSAYAKDLPEGSDSLGPSKTKQTSSAGFSGQLEGECEEADELSQPEKVYSLFLAVMLHYLFGK